MLLLMVHPLDQNLLVSASMPVRCQPRKPNQHNRHNHQRKHYKITWTLLAQRAAPAEQSPYPLPSSLSLFNLLAFFSTIMKKTPVKTNELPIPNTTAK